MKKLLILYPHWPPSNLAGVHRARLISNFLSDFDWQCTVLTVSEEFYEEKPDYELLKTVAKETKVVKVEARPVKNANRLIGDITLRAWSNLKRKAIQLIRDNKFDFLWVPIPSFYSAILARQIHEKTNIPYGIDYIDPWVDSFVGQDKLFSKPWITNQIAKVMEPYAVKKASLISGVSTPYYQAVLDRNFKKRSIQDVGMPYGFDPKDHQIMIDELSLPWQKNEEAFVYAGAFLPKSHLFLKLLFEIISKLKQNNQWPGNRKLYFLGTGNYPGKQITVYAREYQIEAVVHELTDRFPFLHILNFIAKAKGVMVIGSTEAHYTASKVFQALLSERPVLGIFHQFSSASRIMQECNADDYLINFDPDQTEKELFAKFKRIIPAYFELKQAWSPNLEMLDNYSARESAGKLAEKLDLITNG